MRLVTGEADINPMDYAEKLKSKNVLLIHGKNDTVVAPKRSEEFAEMIGCRCIIRDMGHDGNNVICEPDIVTDVREFLR